MEPYYHDGAVTIYHGDCADVLPYLPQFDLVLTDPPYGVGKWNSSGGQSLKEHEVAVVNGWDVAPADELLRAVVAKGRHAIVWGGNYLCGALGPFRSPLVWDKGIRGMHFAEGEIAWTNFDYGTLRILDRPIASTDVKGNRLHPTQKPVTVMTWALQQAKPLPTTVLDPFLGSGTTLVAAKSLGMTAVGIERDERYCEISAQRLSQGVLDLAVGV